MVHIQVIAKVFWVVLLSIYPLPVRVLPVLTGRSPLSSSVPPSGLLPEQILSTERSVSRTLPGDPTASPSCGSTLQYPFSIVCAIFRCPVPAVWLCVVVVVHLALEQLPPQTALRLFFRYWIANPAPVHNHNLSSLMSFLFRACSLRGW